MKYLKTSTPHLHRDETYYLSTSNGWVPVKYTDLCYRGTLRMDENNELHFNVMVMYKSEAYHIDNLYKKDGNCVVKCDRDEHTVSLGIIGRHEHNTPFSFECRDDNEWYINTAWYTANGGAIKCIRKFNDFDFESYVFFTTEPCGMCRFSTHSSELYCDEAEAKFYNRCPAVSEHTLADYFCVSEEEMKVIKTKLQDLRDWLDSRGIECYYSTDDYMMHFARTKSTHVPKEWECTVEDYTNDDPQSMFLPNSAFLADDTLNIQECNYDYRVVLNHNEPETNTDKE